ncbi:unnamed protein product [Cylicocyclus nassatus]|uniref:Uncharacterized protein n=1 Tax=Cylicocyclus nassatus TaxID=53992 RepID=A0AA36DNI8_CYLNA|nr:unnamed protein product [Cylicocyclus nassatus]
MSLRFILKILLALSVTCNGARAERFCHDDIYRLTWEAQKELTTYFTLERRRLGLRTEATWSTHFEYIGRLCFEKLTHDSNGIRLECSLNRQLLGIWLNWHGAAEALDVRVTTIRGRKTVR